MDGDYVRDPSVVDVAQEIRRVVARLADGSEIGDEKWAEDTASKKCARLHAA